MNTLLLIFLAGIVAISSALVVPFLSPEQLLALISIAILICIMCGWISTFEVKGVHMSKTKKEFFTYGFAVPVFKNWLSPIKRSINTYILILSASLITGALFRVFILIA